MEILRTHIFRFLQIFSPVKIHYYGITHGVKSTKKLILYLTMASVFSSVHYV